MARSNQWFNLFVIYPDHSFGDAIPDNGIDDPIVVARNNWPGARFISSTEEQVAAFNRLFDRWQTVSEPSPMIGSECVTVQVTGENGCSMILGIETDGYTHS